MMGGVSILSLRDRLAALGVKLHDIIAGNLSQVPQHNANSHEYFAVHYLGVNGARKLLISSGTSGHRQALATYIRMRGTETPSASSAPHTRHPEGMMILRLGILRRLHRRRQRSLRRAWPWSTASRSIIFCGTATSRQRTVRLRSSVTRDSEVIGRGRSSRRECSTT